jgi:antitoxin (DNA-binding transcriptional repressor) of toxin-antitoxin stability system
MIEMTAIPIGQASAQLPTLLSKLAPGEEIVLTDGEKPIATVKPVREDEPLPKRRRGTAKGVLTIISEDDDHLKDFAEYM